MDSKLEIESDGSKVWKNYQNDFHREDGPAVEYKSGIKYWFIRGKLHRENAPAIERGDGYEAWYINGVPHRENGPAITYSDGRKIWYLNGIKYSEKEFYKKMRTKRIESLRS